MHQKGSEPGSGTSKYGGECGAANTGVAASLSKKLITFIPQPWQKTAVSTTEVMNQNG